MIYKSRIASKVHVTKEIGYVHLYSFYIVIRINYGVLHSMHGISN